MFRILKTIFSTLTIAMLCLLSVTSAFAAQETNINEHFTANVGDKFTYSMYMSDCTEGVLGVQMYVFYDKEYLEIDPSSVTFERFNGAIYNANLDGYMTLNWTNISQLADFSSRAGIVSMDFTVLKEGNAEITYFIREMYGEDMEHLKSYKITYDVTKDGETIVSEQTPLVNGSDAVLGEYQGDFINYLDGMGEENSPNKENHQSYTGVKTTISNNANNSSQSGSSSGSKSLTTVVVIGGLVLLIVLIAIVMVFKRKESDKDSDNKTT